MTKSQTFWTSHFNGLLVTTSTFSGGSFDEGVSLSTMSSLAFFNGGGSFETLPEIKKSMWLNLRAMSY